MFNLSPQKHLSGTPRCTPEIRFCFKLTDSAWSHQVISDRLKTIARYEDEFEFEFDMDRSELRCIVGLADRCRPVVCADQHIRDHGF